MSKVEVQLVNKLNPSIVLEKGEFTLVRGCLPLREIMNKWRIRNVSWFDVLIFKILFNNEGRYGA